MKRFITCLLLATICSYASAADYFSSFSTSSHSSASVNGGSDGLKMKLVDTPLSDALQMIAQTGRIEVLAEPEALSRLELPVSVSASGLNIDAAIERVLAPSKLHYVAVSKNQIVVTTHPCTAKELDADKLVSMRSLAIYRALDKEVPLTLFSTPLDMALQMAEGFSGVAIEIEPKALRRAGVSPMELISIDSQGKTFGESLDAMLSPLGLTYRVGSRGIVVVPKSSEA